MSVEFTPVGVACNLSCSYCYQQPMRDAKNITAKWDWEAARATLDRLNSPFIVFGGEPLLTPKDRLEQILDYGFKKWGQTGIQTNGSLIDRDFYELFKKYNTHVGFSLDGPEYCSLSRWSENIQETLDLVKISDYWLHKMVADGHPCSLIVTLWSGNCSVVDFPNLKNWLIDLDRLGLKYARLHLLEVDTKISESQRVDEDLLINRLKELASIQWKNLDIDLFTEMKRLLAQDGQTSCVWNACDPLTTEAVQGVSANGTLSNCGRVNKDGVDWRKGEQTGHERQLVLYNTPFEYGGCKDCRFFLACKGQCPGTAIDGDWRNRSEHCQVYFKLFEAIEKQVPNATSLRTNRKQLEMDYLKSLVSGGTHADAPHGDAPHGDSHGDSPHGDAHGDSYRVQVPVGRPA